MLHHAPWQRRSERQRNTHLNVELGYVLIAWHQKCLLSGVKAGAKDYALAEKTECWKGGEYCD
jgi:hypothetical protein